MSDEIEVERGFFACASCPITSVNDQLKSKLSELEAVAEKMQVKLLKCNCLTCEDYEEALSAFDAWKAKWEEK